MTTFRRNPATMPFEPYVKYNIPEPTEPVGPFDPWHPTGHGFLYNFFAVQDARKVAPNGWEVWDDDAVNNLVAELKSLNPADTYPLGAGNRTGKKMNSPWKRNVEGFPGWVNFLYQPNNAGHLFFTPTGRRVGINGEFEVEGQHCYLWIDRTITLGGQSPYDSPYYLITFRNVESLTYRYITGRHRKVKNYGRGIRCYMAKDREEKNLDTGTLTDIDNNIYKYVVWGDYRYMMENLKTTHYRNGDPITHITNNNTWASATAGAFCEYNNNAHYVG